MSLLESLAENWKSVLAIVVLVIVNVLTFSAQEMALQRERELATSLINSANENANREARLLATIAAQATRIGELEAAAATAAQHVAETATPERVTRATTMPTSTPRASVTPTPAPSATAATAARQTYYITTPGGAGAQVRAECRADSPARGVWPDGTQVTVEEASSACPGSLRVVNAAGESGWVADNVLSAAPPR